MQSPPSHPSPQKRLGPSLAVYGDRPIGWKDLAFKFTPAILLVLTPFTYGLWRVLYARVNYGPSAAQVWGWPWFALSAVALIPLLWFALRRVESAHRVVRVYQNGLLIRETRGRNRRLLWSEISGIAGVKSKYRFLGISLGERYQATLYPGVGKPIKFNPGLPHLEELCARIKGKIYPRLLPELRAMRQDHKDLYFGALTLCPQGVRLRDKALRWDKIKTITVHKGRLVLELNNQRTPKIPVGGIPNIELFIQLIQEGVDV